jgi:hypothetical protein
MLAAVTRLWRVSVVDGLFRRDEGWGVVLAESEDQVRAVVAEYLRHSSAYGKPFEVSHVEPYDHPEAQVLVYEDGAPLVWPRKYEDFMDEGPPEQAEARAVRPRRFTAPDGQAFFARRDGHYYVFWLEADEDERDEAFWDPTERYFAVVPLARTLGYRVGRDEFPPWLDALATQVVHDLWGDPEPA